MALFNGSQQEYYETNNKGSYQYIALADIINNFIVSYVGDDKIITTAKKNEVAFHAQRAIQELNYDTLRSIKSYEIEVPPSLSLPLPHDYVNYVKVTWTDINGVERLVIPNRFSSTPNAILQDDEYNYLFDSETGDLLLANYSETEKLWAANLANTTEGTEDEYQLNVGTRYGLNPETTTKNGAFYIDEAKGQISFSADFVGKIIIIKYVSDGLSTDDIKVHKFAEEAIYKHIAYSIVSTKAQVPEYQVRRLQKERYSATRKAKLRLSNLKIEELTQVMRGKSKQIKH